MRILFVGDIVGRSGREKVKELLPKIREDYKIDYTIANAENSAHGKGVTKKIYYDLLGHGVDFITLGNHAFSKSEIKLDMPILDKMIRPGNFKDTYVGEWYRIIKIHDKSVCICNLLGQVFMDVCDRSPYGMMEELLERTNCDFYICDIHAEATGEKLAFAHYFSDRVHMVVGTHTHVQTADNRIINKCAYISDVGMCGPYAESVLGRDVNEVILNNRTGEKTRFTVAETEACFSALVVELDEEKLEAISCERIYILP